MPPKEQLEALFDVFRLGHNVAVASHAARLLDVVHHLPSPLGVPVGVQHALLMVRVVPVRGEQVSADHVCQEVVRDGMLG